jgi:hypothetical protein
MEKSKPKLVSKRADAGGAHKAAQAKKEIHF